MNDLFNIGLAKSVAEIEAQVRQFYREFRTQPGDASLAKSIQIVPRYGFCFGGGGYVFTPYILAPGDSLTLFGLRVKI